jgi:hypothetical protein
MKHMLTPPLFTMKHMKFTMKHMAHFPAHGASLQLPVCFIVSLSFVAQCGYRIG